MSRSFKVFLFFVFLVLIFPIIGLVKWTFQGKESIQLLILDKTVPTLERNKHRSFNWILNHEKYVKANNRRYLYKKDYYGFFPLKPLRNRQYDIKRIRLGEIINMAEEYDGAYFTDTYGVYFNDWYQGINKNRRSRKIYGGLLNNDYLLFKELKDRNKLIIAEYKTLTYPTPDLERSKMEALLDVHWTGWVGRYFESLDTIASPDLPEWVIRLYNKQYGKAWEFHKSGIVLVQYNDRVVVLENEEHLDHEVPYIYSSKYAMQEYDLPYKMNYPYWFEIMEPGGNIELANFKIHTNSAGDSIMLNNFIPNEFPAIITGPGEAPYYYFGGDFADNDVKPILAYFYGVEKVAPYLFY
ncbi:MAG: hypothetical protein U9N53_13420, partial [Bacteroidota bacterium]|nr:hypothetical protein [Bacteroidota bacterium]